MSLRSADGFRPGAAGGCRVNQTPLSSFLHGDGNAFAVRRPVDLLGGQKAVHSAHPCLIVFDDKDSGLKTGQPHWVEI